MTTKTLKKTAVDSEAAEFWTSYYKDSGYGALWVQSIRKRVSAALEQKAPKTAKKASGAEPRITPIATVVGENGVTLEGLAVYGQGDSRVVKAFVADFDHQGKILSFDAVDA